MMRTVLATLPRSGTHWFKHMLADCLGGGWVNKRYADVAALQAQLAEPGGLITDHFDHDRFGGFLGADHRLVMLVRHPLDALISNFHKRETDGILPDPSDTAESNLKRFIRGEFDHAGLCPKVRGGALFSMTWHDYLRRYALEWMRVAYVVRYENLVNDPVPELCAVAGVGRDVAIRAAETHSFKNLSGGRERGEVDARSHYRRGLPDEWRTFYDASDLAAVDARAGSVIRAMGYGL